MNASFDSIIFDLDGTLWDASPSCAKAWNEALKRSGIPNREVDDILVRSFSGLKLDSIMQQSFSFLDAPAQAALTRHYQNCEIDFMKKFGGCLYPDVQDVLIELKKGFGLYIVSNCLSGYIENFLKFHRLEEFFEDYECSGNTGLSKAENIKLLISRNLLRKSVYVGDTMWDQQASALNEIPFVFASYGFGTAFNAVNKIDNFKDLLNIEVL